MKICVVNQKGGSGKSLVSLMIGAGLQHQGRPVELIDLDPQGSLLDLAEMAGVASTKGSLHQVVDTAPTVYSTATEVAMRGADLVVVPTSTSVADIRVTMSTLPLIASLSSNVVVVLNKVQTNTKAGKTIGGIKKYIADESGVRVAESIVKNRTAYQHDFVNSGIKGLTKDTREEVLQLVVELLKI